jgi:WD40 repeat protein
MDPLKTAEGTGGAPTCLSCQILFSGEDEGVNIWDWRDIRRPKIKLDTNNGAQQVCWERVHGNVLASSHANDIKLWDPRQFKYPLEYISAHSDHIIALDFSTNRASRLVSSSRDHLIKFWDVKDMKRYREERRISTPEAPVWKIRYGVQGVP